MKLDVVYNKSCQQMDELPDESIDTTMTSPPYWGLRDYGEDVAEDWGAWHGQLGLEPTFQLYLDHMLIVCAEVKRVLKKTGSFWLNMGDTYGGSWQNFGSREGGQRTKSTQSFERKDNPQFYPPTARATSKCLIGIPWRLVLRLIDEQNWILRNCIIWHKPNAMPSSVKDRCSNSYEFLFHLVKTKKYYYGLDAIREKQKYPEDVIRRMKQDKEAGVKPFQKGSFVSRHIKKTNYKTRDPERHINICGKNPGDVWLIPTQPRPEAHFATFPDKLCIKPILATCPAEICKKCGKARVRIIKKTWDNPVEAKRDLPDWHKIGASRMNRGQYPTGVNYHTIGWADCGCNADFNSGVLLDPFTGRGTTLIMAKKLGRHYVGYELKKEYCEKLIRPALEEIDPLFSRACPALDGML